MHGHYRPFPERIRSLLAVEYENLLIHSSLDIIFKEWANAKIARGWQRIA